MATYVEDDIQELILALKDKNDDVKIYTIGLIVDNSRKELAIDALGELLNYSFSVNVRRKAAWALGRIANKKANEFLVRALSDTDAQVRVNAVFALGRIGSKEEAIPVLLEKLCDENAEVRNEAALVLDYFGWKPLSNIEKIEFMIAKKQWEKLSRVDGLRYEHLKPYLNDSDSDIVEELIKLLGIIRDDRAVEYLINILLNSNSKNLQSNAAKALAKIGGKSTTELLVKELNNEDWFIRKSILDALGEIGDPTMMKYIVKKFRDPVTYVSQSAKKAALKIKSLMDNKE